TRSTPASSRASGSRARRASTRASKRPCGGIATARTGGGRSRSGTSRTASTTARSTATGSRRPRRPRSPRDKPGVADAAVATVEGQPRLLPSPRPMPGEPLRVLVTGASGMLGSDITPALAAAAWDVYPRPRADLDVTDEARVVSAFRDVDPHVVVNCAAFTKVDACETDPDAWAVNAGAVDILARECRRRGARLVQISTDFVFDGGKTEPYTETDETAPLSMYGRGKR